MMAAWCRENRSSNKSGGCTRIPTRGPSTTLLFDCGAILKTIPRNRGICSRCVAWDTAFWRILKKSEEHVLRAAKFRNQGFPALECDSIHAAKDHTVS